MSSSSSVSKALQEFDLALRGKKKREKFLKDGRKKELTVSIMIINWSINKNWRSVISSVCRGLLWDTSALCEVSLSPQAVACYTVGTKLCLVFFIWEVNLAPWNLRSGDAGGHLSPSAVFIHFTLGWHDFLCLLSALYIRSWRDIHLVNI